MFCADGSSQVDHDGGPTLSVGERAEPSTASDALGTRDRHTIFHISLLFLTSFTAHVHLHGIKTDSYVVFLKSKEKPDQIYCHLP